MSSSTNQPPIVDGFTIPVTKPGHYPRVSWGPPAEMGFSLFDVRVHVWTDGYVRVHVNYHDGSSAWCERQPVDGDTIIDYMRVAGDDSSFKHGSNGYFYAPAVDDNGERGTDRHAETGLRCQPDMIVWRSPDYKCN